MTLRITVVMAAFAAAVVTMVWVTSVVPTSGDGPGSTGGPVGGTTERGGGGLTTPGDVPLTSALWSANIGGTTRTGLDTDSVGSILYRGTKRLTQVPTIDGESRAVEVCQGFPEISVSQTGASNAPGGGIKLRLDFNECVVRVDELTRTNIGVFADTDEELTMPTRPTSRTARAYPIAWWPQRTAPPEIADTSRSAYSRGSRLIGSIEDRAQYDLTRVEINRVYRLSDPLEPVSYSGVCRTNSIFDGHIRWSNNECIGDQLVVAGRVRAWARGRFDAEVVREGTSLNRDPRHTVYLHLEGTADGDSTKTCTFSPHAIRRLEATFAPTNPLFWLPSWVPLLSGPYGVTVDCRHREFFVR